MNGNKKDYIEWGNSGPERKHKMASLNYRPCLKTLDVPLVVIEYRETNRGCGGRCRKRKALIAEGDQ